MGPGSNRLTYLANKELLGYSQMQMGKGDHTDVLDGRIERTGTVNLVDKESHLDCCLGLDRDRHTLFGWRRDDRPTSVITHQLAAITIAIVAVEF